MKARTISLAHEQVIKATLDTLRTMSLAHANYVTRPWASDKGDLRTCGETQPQLSQSSVTKELHHSPIGE